MDNLLAMEKTRDHCLQEIARRTPPVTRREMDMIYAFYRQLGDIESRLQIAKMSSTASKLST